MANQLKMAIVQAILQLHALGWSQLRMATELQIDRETVARYLKLYQNGAKPATAPPGRRTQTQPLFPVHRVASPVA
ncbi:MAG: hypothetical protein ACR2FY_10085 [Pirellulaceae bacterium]